MFCRWYRRDPGPCPVDDTPHTACTPASISGGSSLTVPLKRPGWLPPEPTVTGTFTTKDYTRKKHNPSAKRLRVR